ncbi:MAG: helix-turn-helix domain-containing protein [Bacilli bacterium]
MSQDTAVATLRPRVSAKRIAEMYDMSEAAIQRYARLGQIPCVRIGKLVRFDPVEVEAALVGQADAAEVM